MHELSIAESLLDILEQLQQEQGFLHLRRVTVETGALSAIDPHALQFAFEAIRAGTIAQDAELTIDQQPAHITCKHCSYTGQSLETVYCCPNCQSVDIHIEGQTDITITSLETD